MEASAAGIFAGFEERLRLEAADVATGIMANFWTPFELMIAVVWRLRCCRSLKTLRKAPLTAKLEPNLERATQMRVVHAEMECFPLGI